MSKPLYESQIKKIQEAFSSGSHEKVLRLLAKILNNRIKGKISFDFTIPFAYKTSTGDKIRSYRGFFKDGSMIYINFLLVESDYVDSFYVVNRKFVITDVIKFDSNTNIIQVINTIVDYINGNFEENEDMNESKIFTSKFKKILEANTAQERLKIFLMWLQQSVDKNKHFNMLSTEKPTTIYKNFVLTMEKEFPETLDSKYFPDSGNFVKMIKEFAKSNGISNPHIKFRVARRQPKVQVFDLPVGTLSEDQPIEKVMASGNVAIAGWQEEFSKLEDKVDMLLALKVDAPYGLLIYGTGGTGKSYYANKIADSMGDRAVIEKDIKNVADFRDKLYSFRNKELVILDDADKVIGNFDMCTLLKTALDDTVGERNNGVRFIGLPPSAKITDEGVTPDGKHYAFKPDVIIITNSDKVAEPALWTRLMKSPLYLDKQDIIDKIVANSGEVIARYEVSKDQVLEIADYIVALFENPDNKIADEQLSFRLFKSAVQFIKFYPTKWRGQVNTELLVGVKLAKDIQKTGKVK